MIWLLTIFIIIYLTLVIFLLMGWESMPLFVNVKEREPSTFISIIIPARNEEKNIRNILKDIHAQNYPRELFEVIVVNDNSTDGTEKEVKKNPDVRLINLADLHKSGKKKAIETAIEASKGKLIVCTDADCRAGEEWLSALESFYYRTGARMICGPVCFTSNGTLWQSMQEVEFASLIGSGAACLSLRFPNMCNGANIAYEKSTFIEVGGFSGNEDIASGDDEFLMHKIALSYPGKIKFLKSKEATILTSPAPDLASFFNQRVRWAGKWKNYSIKGPQRLAAFIFLFHLAFIAGGIAVLTGYLDPVLFLQQILIKFLFEFVFLNRVMAFFGKKINILPFIIVELIYPFYVVFTAVLTLKGSYTWKGRTIKSLNLERKGI